MEAESGNHTFRLQTNRKIPLSKQLAYQRILLVFLLHVLAVVALYYYSTFNLIAFLVMHFAVGCLGTTIGFHRLLTHRSFKCKTLFRNFLALLGTLSVQGGPLSWVAIHRAHHAKVDRVGDPHSAALGFFWSHMGWVFVKAPNGFRLRSLSKQTADLSSSKFLNFLENHWLILNALAFFAGVFLIGWQASLWAFPLRVVVLWHSTWLVNSIGHRHLLEKNETRVEPRNIHWLAWISYGEGFHRNHHQNPSTAVLNKNKFEVDLGACVLHVLEMMRIVEMRKASAQKI